MKWKLIENPEITIFKRRKVKEMKFFNIRFKALDSLVFSLYSVTRGSELKKIKFAKVVCTLCLLFLDFNQCFAYVFVNLVFDIRYEFMS